MTYDELKYCPGTLAEGFRTYSPGCLRKMFNGKKVHHVLLYDSPGKSGSSGDEFLENRKYISISGMQEKMSMVLEKNRLRLSQKGEQGTYILKPKPRDLKQVDQVPANEHLTMQIARQIYGIKTAENAFIFFRDGGPAYITKRFDVNPAGGKWATEDFAVLAGKTSENAGDNFKYDFSYEEIGLLIQRYVAAAPVELERFFTLVVFNYIFSNGDAHLKNFSLMETARGDYLLSPAYDLINTHLHVNDADFALNRGLFADEYKSDYYKKTGHPSQNDFKEFAKRIGIRAGRAEKLLLPFLEKQPEMEILINRSFLNRSNKKGYLLSYNQKRNFLLGR